MFNFIDLKYKKKLFFIKINNKIYNFFLRTFLFKTNRDIQLVLQRKSLNETIDFVEKNLYKIKAFNDKFKLLRHSFYLRDKKLDLILEFGVYKGLTINYIAKLTDKNVYGFDSFEGLPENWRSNFEKSYFNLKKIPRIRKNVLLKIGFFDKTLPKFIKKHRNNSISFIHVDCDLFSSTKTILTLLNKQIVKNTIIVFDEYFNYPGWKKGEYKAFVDFVKKYNRKFKYIAYNQKSEQVAIQILK